MKQQFKTQTTIFIFLIITIMGCKNYTCECTTFSSNSPSGGTGHLTVRGTKAKAQEKCESHSFRQDSIGSETRCVLK